MPDTTAQRNMCLYAIVEVKSEILAVKVDELIPEIKTNSWRDSVGRAVSTQERGHMLFHVRTLLPISFQLLQALVSPS